MSNFNGSNVGVQGDGNAVGDNNQLFFNKETHHHHGNNGGSGGGGNDAGAFFFAILVACIAMALASFHFARHAGLLYVLMRTLAGLNLFVSLTVLWRQSQREERLRATAKTVAAACVALVASAGLGLAHADFPTEVSRWAGQAGGARVFWCALSPHGQQTVFLHAFTGVFGFLAGLVFLSPATFIPAFKTLFDIRGSEGARRVLARLTSWSAVVFSAILMCGATYSHTESGRQAWSHVMKQPPTPLVCTRPA